jgi:hypothetical protein
MVIQGFKKFALVTAIAAVPMGAFALQALNDSQMSNVAGRDGVTLTIKTPPTMTFSQTIYDRDGIGATSMYNIAANAAGVIKLENMQLGVGSQGVQVVVDGGQTASGNGVLNLDISIPSGLTIQTGNLKMGNTVNAASINYNDNSGGSGSWKNAATWAVNNLTGTIMNSVSINLGPASMNMQLGHVAQQVGYDWNGTTFTGNWSPAVVLSTTVTGGITVSGLSLNDLGSTNPGSFSIGSIKTTDNGGADLHVGGGTVGANHYGDGIGIDVTDQGLALGIGSMGRYQGATYAGIDETVSGIRIGSPTGPSLGNLTVQGLDLSGTTVTISGH